MKKIKNNDKGFTLIELLAVIVILAILVIVAIPAVTKYLETSRQSTYIDTARATVDAVRQDYVIHGSSNTDYNCKDGVCKIDKEGINKLLEKKLITSPYGNTYKAACITIEDKNTDGSGNVTKAQGVTYKICLTDDSNKGVNDEENALKVGTVNVCPCTNS